MTGTSHIPTVEWPLEVVVDGGGYIEGSEGSRTTRNPTLAGCRSLFKLVNWVN